MSTGTIFFSYSRNDSETILNIAKELRQAGAAIWLDQLDIKPGSRWDDEIEGALQSSGTLIIALTKSSVASQNVMDEVSYALEEGKQVVPMLLEQCEIPFRLRRLQYSDFTVDYKTGMKSLSEVLGLDKEVAAKLTHNVSDAPTTKTVQKEKEAPAPTAKAQPKAAAAPISTAVAPKRRNLTPIYAIGGVIVLLAVLYFSGVFSGEEKDKMALCKADWEQLESTINEGKEVNELAALRKHIELYAPCPHENEAMDRISFLNAIGETSEGGNTENIEDTEDNSTSPNTNPPVNNTKTTNTGNTDKADNSKTEETPVEVIEKGLNIKEVVRVEFDSGYFEKVAVKNWLESNDGKERSFRLLKADKNAIYLGAEDDSNVVLALNITELKIYYSDANNAPFHLYTITNIK